MLIAAFFKVQQQLINTRRGGGAQGLKLAPPPVQVGLTKWKKWIDSDFFWSWYDNENIFWDSATFNNLHYT